MWLRSLTSQRMWLETSRLLAAKLTATEITSAPPSSKRRQSLVTGYGGGPRGARGGGGGGGDALENMRLEAANGLWELVTCSENHSNLKEVVAEALVEGVQAAAGRDDRNCPASTSETFRGVSDTAVAIAAAAASAVWKLSVTPAARDMLVRAGVVGAVCALEHAVAV